MKTSLLLTRYYLEILALPAFVFLVIHLSGHGIGILLFGEDHEHESTDTMAIQNLYSLEVLIGLFFLFLFTWLWHRPILKKWVPCTHEHCHSEYKTAHILAIVAFCIHFFPEAGVRKILLENAFSGEVISVLGIIAFAAHFLVDILVTISLSGYFPTQREKILSVMIIVVVWTLAFFSGEHFAENIPSAAEGVVFVFSAFLLAMFVHMPHKPVIRCETCDHRE